MIRTTMTWAGFMVTYALCFSQSAHTQLGARAAGIGYSSTTLADEWSISNNIGGLYGVSEATAAVAFEVVPQLPTANRMAGVLAIPTHAGTLGASIFRFGDKIYNEQIITLGFSNKFGISSIGGKLDYIQFNTEGFGRIHALSVGLGMITEIIPSIRIGAYVNNINQQKIAEDETLSTLMNLGVAYLPNDRLLLSTEVEKQVGFPPTWKGGLEYSPLAKLYFRTGYNINPNTMYAGLGINKRNLKVNYAFAHSLVWGANHQLSVALQLTHQ